MKDTDHLIILNAVKSLPFNVGKKLLIDFLRGNDEHPSIINNRLDLLPLFGEMGYDEEELEELIDSLLREGYLEHTSVAQNKYWKVLKLTNKGFNELKDPKRGEQVPKKIKENKTIITEKDKEVFSQFDFFLSKYNDEQKKAIISPTEKIICIAGAGSGKTSVLTKRIEFLIKFKTIHQSKILAITFTRKAKEEMIKRLERRGIHDVRIETFNSFCEKILILHEKKIYGKPIRVMTYKDKVLAVRKAIHSLGMTQEFAIKTYFSENQMRAKTNEQLMLSFVNDCFMVLDYLKSKGKTIDDLRKKNKNFNPETDETAFMLSKICENVNEQMKEQGLRDYTDQMMDAIKFFKETKDLIPKFEHILVDEYQDVNSTQIDLLDLLSPQNIFCVGDPRQSIFGWRGSDIKYIMTFTDKYSDSEIITLTRNYRSTKFIVELMNKSIAKMHLPDLVAVNEGKKDLRLLNFESESVEYEFVAQRILHCEIERENILILARTNRQLKDVAETLARKDIKHVLRTDEINKNIEAKRGEVTVATVHAIKGLEAKMVFVVGCNSLNFPCKTSDHPATEIIDIEEYDKEEEERRLFYVAISRAQDSLYLTYTGRMPTYFITDDMKKTIFSKDESNKDTSIFEKLREWRLRTSKKEGVPPYIIMKDETLTDLAEKLPLSSLELSGIKGLGPSRISRFGKDILHIINHRD
ncbi:MAG: UvrD-helicase domain-containing protein [Candidatus Nanoarchaeia archaeon]